MVERVDGEHSSKQRYKVVIAEMKKRQHFRRKTPKRGGDLSFYARRIGGSRTIIWTGGDPASIYSKRKLSPRVLSVEPISEEEARRFFEERRKENQRRVDPESVRLRQELQKEIAEPRPFYARPNGRPDGKKFLLLIQPWEDPQSVAQGFFKTLNPVVLISANPDEFCDKARELHAIGVRLNPNILQYAGINSEPAPL